MGENSICFQEKEGGHRGESLAKFWLLAEKRKEKEKIYKNSKIKQKPHSIGDGEIYIGGGNSTMNGNNNILFYQEEGDSSD